jgi:hypothetical protein
MELVAFTCGSEYRQRVSFAGYDSASRMNSEGKECDIWLVVVRLIPNPLRD